MTTTTTEAQKRYLDLRHEIAVLMDCVEMELDAHQDRAAKAPDDWGLVGDLGRVRDAMHGVLSGLLVGRFGYSEAEADTMIAEHLGDWSAGETANDGPGPSGEAKP